MFSPYEVLAVAMGLGIHGLVSWVGFKIIKSEDTKNQSPWDRLGPFGRKFVFERSMGNWDASVGGWWCTDVMWDILDTAARKCTPKFDWETEVYTFEHAAWNSHVQCLWRLHAFLEGQRKLQQCEMEELFGEEDFKLEVLMENIENFAYGTVLCNNGEDSWKS